MKVATGRPKDERALMDLVELRALRHEERDAP